MLPTIISEALWELAREKPANPFLSPPSAPPPAPWWDELYRHHPLAKPPGDPLMLRLIVYDISQPKLLKRVAKVCEDFGLRVQKSVFECWLEKERFDRFWEALLPEIDK